MTIRFFYFSFFLAAAAGGCSKAKSPSGHAAAISSCADAGTSAAGIACLEDAGALPSLDRGDSVAGPDRDADGVRDDLDAFIGAQSYSESESAAVKQLARGFQAAVVAGAPNGVLSSPSTQDALAIATRVADALACVRSRFTDVAAATTVVHDCEEFTANTKPRVLAYLAYNHALSGTTLARPAGDGCEN